jgi:hypothetical protein
MEALAKAQADNATAKEEALSPSYHRRMTASEINEISERVRQDHASKIGHKYEHVNPNIITKDKLRPSHGPCGGESTPPFGCGDSWAVNKKLNEVTLHDEDAVGIWPDAPEMETVELTPEVVDLLCQEGIKALVADEEAVVLSPEELNTLDTNGAVVLTDYPLEAEAQDRSVREYFEAKDPVNPVHTYATEWARLNTEKIDREILAQRDEMREQRSAEDLKAAINEYQTIVAECGTPECHGDGEVYGRSILDAAQQEELKEWAGARTTMGVADEEDLVNSPTHYNQFGLECIDAIKLAVGEEGFIGYCHGNALKYLWRAEYKENKKTDFAKAAWYARMAGGDDPRDD